MRRSFYAKMGDIRMKSGEIFRIFVHFDGSCGGENTNFLAKMRNYVIMEYKRVFTKL